MALIDKLRFHNILTRGGIPEAPAIEFTDALQDTFDEQTSPLATKADLQNAVLELKRDAAEREARRDRQMLNVAIGVIGVNLAAIATAVGIILGFN